MSEVITKRRMGDLCNISSSKRIYAVDYRSEGVPFYRGKEIIEKQRGALGVTTELFIEKTKFQEIKARFGAPVAGDLLLTSVGTLGVPYVVKRGEEFYFKDGNLTWFRDFNGLNSQFLYYWLLSPDGRAEQKKCTIGSSQPAYTIILLKAMEIALPELSVQHKIVAILSAYDYLIDNNNRRIKILEDMAQMLYREWFVEFKYPGHEQVEMWGSELGPIPEGWEVTPFTSAVGINAPTTGRKGTEKPYVDMAGLSTTSMVIKCSATREGSSGTKFINGDTLFARITPCLENGKTGFVQFLRDTEVGIGSTEFIVFRSQKLTPEYVYLLARSDNFRELAIKSMSGTSGRQRVQVACFDELRIAVPPRPVLDGFSDLIDPFFRQVQVLFAKNANLRRTRDLLLPRLVSGELDVSELDIIVGDE